MPELGPYGSVRGARSNERPYRENCSQAATPRKEKHSALFGDAGASAKRRCKTSLTQSRSRRKNDCRLSDSGTINPAAHPGADGSDQVSGFYTSIPISAPASSFWA